MSKNNFSRRNFLAGAAAIGAVGAVGLSALTSCSSGGKKRLKEIGSLNLPPLLDEAPDGKPLKAGLIGCGGRGTGAAINFLGAGPNLSITALGDVFDDRLQSCRKKIKERFNNEVADENCFIGFDAYQKVIDSGVDIVILATPPKFRAEQFEAAVQARKHVFLEKPVAVDPVGIRSVMASAKKAESLGLKIVTGTQRRHQRDYIDIYKQVMSGDIGEIVAANCYWNQSQLWHRNPQAGWSEMEAMIRDWVNWLWLSGDHIVEQHVHNIDVINWFTGTHPSKAVGFGSRQRRPTGDQYDNFSVDFVYDNGIHLHSMCRQINGCENNVSERIQGTLGSSNCRNTIWDLAGNEIYSYAYPKDENGEPGKTVKVNPYDQEHIDLVTCIRKDIPINEAGQTAISNMVAIMGRVSSYTGKLVTYDEMLNSDLKLGPATYIMGDIGFMKTAKVAVPGTASKKET
ncbi:Myo-inositol 2-dehydrogenase [hydrothermal vent metagenome]|uniref:Myo-inositol 2-dehydrogenase n=1 Tax=hydrothermal vent metagenome TaxID=652676 RepID=A0A3B0U1Y0_9ZZZZ